MKVKITLKIKKCISQHYILNECKKIIPVDYLSYFEDYDKYIDTFTLRCNVFSLQNDLYAQKSRQCLYDLTASCFISVYSFSNFFRCLIIVGRFLFAHAVSSSIIGTNSSPIGVRLYSTLGGISG